MVVAVDGNALKAAVAAVAGSLGEGALEEGGRWRALDATYIGRGPLVVELVSHLLPENEEAGRGIGDMGRGVYVVT